VFEFAPDNKVEEGVVGVRKGVVVGVAVVDWWVRTVHFIDQLNYKGAGGLCGGLIYTELLY
jgi:hypothetical protein